MISNRMLQVIKTLNNNKGSMSGKEICFNLGVTTRTLRNDIRDESIKFKKYGFDIESVRGKGYKLNIIDEPKFFNFLSKVIEGKQLKDNNKPVEPKDRVNYIILKLLVANDFIKADDICDEIFISRSTFNNDLIKVKEQLHVFKLAIESKPGHGMIIVGSEINKRFAISTFFNNLNFQSFSPEDFFGPNSYKEISDMLLSFMYDKGFRLTDLGFKNLVIHIIITLIRLKDNFVVPEPLNSKDIIKTKAYEFASDLSRELEQKYKVKIPENERLYIAIHLIGKESSQFIDEARISFDENEVLFNEMFKHINKFFDINLSQDIDLFTSLSLHFKPMKHRLQYNLRIENPLLDKIKAEMVEPFEVSVAAAQIIQKHWGYELSEAEIGYIALHFALSMENYKSNVSQKNILIVCASGGGSSRILYHRLRQQFSDPAINLVVSQLYNLDSYNLKDYDFILTTVPIVENVPIPVIMVDNFLNVDNIKDITKMLDSSNKKFDFIEEYFSEDLFFENIKAKTAIAVIEEMVAKINKTITLPDNFLQSIIDRENFASTEYGNQIAIPHPLKPMTDKTFVAIGILKKPIKWNKNYVKYVLMLSVSKTSPNSLSQFNEVLSTLALDANSMLEFSKMPSLDHLKSILCKIAHKEEVIDAEVVFK